MAFITQKLSADGDGTGSIVGAADGTTPFELSYQPTKVSSVHYVTLLIQDAGFDLTKFGGITALTNGVTLEAKLKGGAETVFSSILSSVKNNCDLVEDIPPEDWKLDVNWAGTDDILIVEFDMRHIHGADLRITPDDEIVLRISDDLQGLTIFRGIVDAEEH